MTNLEEIFAKKAFEKLTENGDNAFSKASVKNELVDILFKTEYYKKHLNEVSLPDGDSRNNLFARFVRDPRYGLGFRDLGRVLMRQAKCTFDEVVKSGRYDDLFNVFGFDKKMLSYLKKKIESGDELAKKWMPRYASKNLLLARKIANVWGMNKQAYGHFIKTNTTENKLSRKNYDDINFEQVPSLAMIKYYKTFKEKEHFKYRFMEYLSKVNKGEAKLNVSTTTVYDIFKNRDKIDADLFFNQIEKIQGSWIPIVDTSGSMHDSNDSIGKALSIGHYLAKCSTYAPDKVISFSSRPRLITLGDKVKLVERYYEHNLESNFKDNSTKYMREIRSMYTGDCSNTNFGAVMRLLKELKDTPEYLIVLSDMEFDRNSRKATLKLEDEWRKQGINTKIIWWNFNSRNQTAPEMDDAGNCYMSGYNPMLLKFLGVGFDADKLINVLLDEYQKNIEA